MSGASIGLIGGACDDFQMAGPTLATHPPGATSAYKAKLLGALCDVVTVFHIVETQYDKPFCGYSVINSGVSSKQNLRCQIQAPLYR